MASVLKLDPGAGEAQAVTSADQSCSRPPLNNRLPDGWHSREDDEPNKCHCTNDTTRRQPNQPLNNIPYLHGEMLAGGTDTGVPLLRCDAALVGHGPCDGRRTGAPGE
jgi:hypothetical protein